MHPSRAESLELILTELRNHNGEMISGDLFKALQQHGIIQSRAFEHLKSLKFMKKITFPLFFVYEDKFKITLLEPKSEKPEDEPEKSVEV